MRQLPLGVGLRTHAVFDSFVPGENVEVVAALREESTVPLWIWGAPGSGKTHLMQAVCAAAGDSAAYFPLRLDSGLPPQALQGFENRRVLCIDDVDTAAGRRDWEVALFALFNTAMELRTRLVFAAKAPPRQLPWELDDWRSRAGACVVYQLRELEETDRIEALRWRATQRGLQLPQETVDYLLKRMPRDLRTLLQIFDELDEASMVEQRRLTVPFIRDALEQNARTKP